MHIKTVKARGRAFFIVCTASGAEFMHFSRMDRAEAWLRNGIYA